MLAINSEEYTELLDNFRSGLRDSILNWFDRKDLHEEQVLSLLESLLRDIGELWNKGDIALIQVYIASKITEEIATKIPVQKQVALAGMPKARVVLGTMEEDNHSLGKNLVRRFLEPFFDVYDLGIDVKSEKFIQKAKEVEADIIAVSTLMMTSVIKIFHLRDLLDSTSWTKKPYLLVGGAPFTMNPTLCRDVGADSYAFNAFDAVDRCIKLMEGRK